ncbi:MAG TPA: tetratricopeptide repeat protein, partial [Vicinamibacterales bacterium]|nr:tetratricopeptide repeat protein [Vicinamibacterales bacterium]
HDAAQALRAFNQAIKVDAKWAPAHLGLARVLAEENPPAAAAAAGRAIEIDPLLAEAHLVLADLDLDNSRYDAARERITTVLEFNPAHLEARAMLGAMSYVRGDIAAFDAEVKRALEINPGYGEVYRVAADLAARHYRFDEAVALARQAVGLDPTSSRAHAELGLHLMRTGDEREARRALERAWERDRFNRVTYNLLTLLDHLDKFTVVRDGEITFKFHPDEATVLREYALPLTREALQKLSARYDFTPKGPLVIEIFPTHDDFAVRTLGLPGMIGALGACFGRVVTLDSPKARPPGTFSWQATLWHELAHVITLQMSNQRVPRWLTEGISVHEEGRARPEWGRDMEVPFAVALERGETLKLQDLNAGFTKPETIALAYYQASLLVDHLFATHGEAAVRTLLRTYGEGLEGEAALSKALGVTFDQLQTSFDKFLDARFGSVRAALRPGIVDGVMPEGKGLDALRASAAARPGSYEAQLALGQALAAARDRAAFEPLEKAAALVPMATGEDSPHAVMARLAEELGDTPRAIREYRALLAHDHAAIEPARRLAALVTKAGDDEAAAFAYGRIVALDPFDAEGHTGLGRLALKKKDVTTAMREFKSALAIGPADRASAHCDLGETYLLAGQPADAKREALAALEIAPSFERAQELLLQAVERTSGGSQ